MTSKRSRKTKAQRLAEAGITAQQFGRYKMMFCKNRLTSKYIRTTPNGWIACPYSWQDRLILMHLTHEETIGLSPADRIDYLMLDIDNHDPGVDLPVADRARRIIDVFDNDPLVYTSSDSSGLRVCYFLDKSYPKTAVYEFARHKLTDAGLEIRSGFVEVMAQCKGDRLPFGRGSYLVDPHTLEPLSYIDLRGMISHAWSVYNGRRLRIDEHVATYHEPSQTDSPFTEIVADLIENGLPLNMTTNTALMKLGWDLICRRGFARDETARFLKSWIRCKHNGNSRRFNTGKIDDLDSHIERVVENCDRKKTNFKSHKPKKPTKRLTIRDVERIVSVFPDYRTQLAAYSLLEHVKNFGALRECIDIDDPGRGEINNSNNTLLGFLQVWEIEIPYTLFIHLDGFDRTHPAKTRKLLEDRGLIKLHRSEDRARHRCRAYLIYFTFDGKSDQIVSLDEALLTLRSPQQLKADYGRYRSAKIVGSIK